MIRNQYLDKIKNFIDSEEVKVLVGLRRSGKSTILEQVRDLIIFNNNCNVIYINFEELK
ncbi:hypothetical protein FACS189459_4990 [Bacilli bacterium]|nr:hypothetical protein FACS189459_4990 [Bacilli bacterium]